MEGSTISPATGLRTSPIPKIMNNFALFCRVRIEYSAAQKTWIKEVRAKLWVFADHDTTRHPNIAGGNITTKKSSATKAVLANVLKQEHFLR